MNRRILVGLVVVIVVGVLAFVLVSSNLLRSSGLVEFSSGERGLNRMAITGPSGWHCIEYDRALSPDGSAHMSGSGMSGCPLFGGTDTLSNSYPATGRVEVPLRQPTLVYRSQDGSYELYVLITDDDSAYERINPNAGKQEGGQVAATAVSASGGDVVIDFAECAATTQQVAVAFGSTTYAISGAQDGVCQMKYGGEVENPNWDGRLDTSCLVPQSLGALRFPINDAGVDFSAIASHCTKE